MKLDIYQVDAFAKNVFEGNPAAVCPLEHWLPDALMQSIASENALSETAFFVREEEHFTLRWFTPACEVDLCGHATLASAHVLFEHLSWTRELIRFETRSGALLVRRSGDALQMDFPAQPSEPCETPEALSAGLGITPLETLRAADLLAVLASPDDLIALNPDLGLLAGLHTRGIIVTAAAPADSDYDFYSRFFAPRVGVPEDPVTGSAHCQLAPYWAARLQKTALRARQVSRRGGEVACELIEDRVALRGHACTFMTGKADIDV